MNGNLLYFTLCYARAVEGLAYIKVTGKLLRRHKIAGKCVLALEEGNHYIYDQIVSGNPFMAARYGSGELSVMVKYITKRMGIIKQIPDRHMLSICNNAGFFPKDQNEVQKFAELMLESSGHLDLLGAWNIILEDYIIKYYAPQTHLTELPTLCSFDVEKPWMAALEGKNVLVIHPFEESIREQYARHRLLFKNPNILPDFNLLTIKAVQTIAGNTCEYDTWFDALNSMTEKAAGMNFDVAIIGCGAYGFPLAANIKKMGKQAIHLGGQVPQMFGIRSKKTDNDPSVSKYYNDYWVRPKESERPKGLEKVEGGCYW